MKQRPYTLVILSAEVSSLTWERNKLRSDALGACLLALGYDYDKCEGTYQGKSETSYAVKAYPDIYAPLSVLDDLAFKTFGQECILVIEAADTAVLWFKDGTFKHIGTWVEAIPNPYEDYTRIGLRTFVVR